MQWLWHGNTYINPQNKYKLNTVINSLYFLFDCRLCLLISELLKLLSLLVIQQQVAECEVEVDTYTINNFLTYI